MKIRLLILALVTVGFSSELFAADDGGSTEAGSANVNTCLDGSCNNQVNTTVLTDNHAATEDYVRRLTDDRHETPTLPGTPATTF